MASQIVFYSLLPISAITIIADIGNWNCRYRCRYR